MGYLVKMPKLGMGMTEGTLLEWFVDVGDAVEAEQVIAEFEAEKTAAEIEAKEDGVLRRRYVEEGETVDPGTVLAIVAGPDEAIDELEATVDAEPVEAADGDGGAATGSAAAAGAQAGDADSGGAPAGSQSAGGASASADAEASGPIRASPRARKRAEELEVELPTVDGSGPEGAITVEDVEAASGAGGEAAAGTAFGAGGETATDADASVRATPKARKRARERGVDLAGVAGSGPKGAVTVADLESGTAGASSELGTAAPMQEAAVSDERTVVEETDLAGIRKTIADRLGRSYREAVHVPVQREIPVDEAFAAAQVIDDYVEPDASLSDVILLALSATLDEHPAFNATFEDGTHTVYREHHVGMAVDADRGLVTPVLRDVGARSLESLVAGRRELTELALSGEYTSEDLSGGTVTVTNLGVLGVDSFAPIINPPEIAILGVGRVTENPVQTDDGVGFERAITFGLTFDHRVVDGADAARFLDAFAEKLTDPWPTVLDRA